MVNEITASIMLGMAELDLSRNLTPEQMGWTLCGTTNEVRGLVLASIVHLDGQASYQQVHGNLLGLNYNAQYPFKPKTNVLVVCQNTPDLIVQEEDGLLTISPELGFHAVSWAGVLFDRLPEDPSASFRNLVGLYKPAGKEIEIPSPAVRRVALEMLARSSSKNPAKRAGVVSEASERTGCDEGIARKQVENLIRLGIAILHNEDGTLTVNPDYQKIIQQYSELVSFFEEDEQLRIEGYNYIQKLMTGESPDSFKIPFFARRSVTGSGRSKTPVLDAFVEKLDKCFYGDEELLTTEIAFRLGLETHLVYDLLQRMERTMPEAAIHRTNIPDFGKVRVRERLWGRKPVKTTV